VRQLYPSRDDAASVDLPAVYAYPEPLDRPYVRANMVSSIDGAVSVAGRSGGLSGPADKELFALLRALADVVLVGAGTVRTEGYRPGRIRAEYAPLRARRGQPAEIPIAITSRSLDLDLSTALFRDARPIVVTCGAADAARLAEVTAVADVVVAGDEHVDLSKAVAALEDRGLRRVLCEGGPRLLGDLAGAGLVDELCLTVSPLIVGGTAPRIVTGDDVRARLALGSVLEDDGALFVRYVRP
jgi:riboflavin-specific deaminase-like protein